MSAQINIEPQCPIPRDNIVLAVIVRSKCPKFPKIHNVRDALRVDITIRV